MKITLLSAIFLLFAGNILFAQSMQHFVTSGTIEYEKRINMFALITRELSNETDNVFGQKAFDQYKKSQPQFKTLKSTLIFGDNKTLFTPIPVIEPPSNFFEVPMAEQNNVTYTDVTAATRVSQKKVFEETFLVKDSVSKIKWKITGETREIAGYTCRRANGLVLDSIYVVAFYTDQIAVVGGPESFTGLPGMILEVALPHENVIWTATKVTDISVPTASLAPPKKGKAVTGAQFKAKLTAAMKQWGNYAQMFLKALQL